MKKLALIFLSVMFFLPFSACGQKAPTWQEQYDLGVRYLSEGNYQEAILAFNAAIEIEPSRGEAYLRAAEAYEAAGNTEQAIEMRVKAFELLADETILQRIGDLVKASREYIQPEIAEAFDASLSIDGFTLGSNLATVKSTYQDRMDYNSNLMNKDTVDTVYSMPYIGHPELGHDEMEFGYFFESTLDGIITEMLVNSDFADNKFFCMGLFHIGDDSESLLDTMGLGQNWNGIPDGEYEMYSDSQKKLDVSVSNGRISSVGYTIHNQYAYIGFSDDKITYFRVLYLE